MHTTTMHPKIVAGDIRSQPQIDGSENPIESIVKLVRSCGKNAPPLRNIGGAPGLEDHLVLPSVWTPKQLGASSSGYRGFDELLEPKVERLGSPQFQHAPFHHANVTKRPASASAVMRSTGCTGLRKLASVPALR